MKQLTYDKFQMQEYLTNGEFNRDEIKLLYSLRSKTYLAKANFKNMNKGNLKCVFQCDQIETQEHIFQNCEPILRRLNLHHIEQIKSVFGSPNEQKMAIQVFIKIDKMRKYMIDLPPGGATARTQNNIMSDKL